MGVSLKGSTIGGLSAPQTGVDEREERRWEIHVASPVRIHTLGRFSVQLQGRPLSGTAGPRYQRSLELLQALIALGGRDVHAELLSQALWPDAEGDKAQNAFDVTLHRLRQLLNIDHLFLLRERRLTLNSELAWVDVWTFERLVNHAERLLARIGEPAVARQLAEDETQPLELRVAALKFYDAMSALIYSLDGTELPPDVRKRYRSRTSAAPVRSGS
jgi:hypothetical protein